MTFFVVLLAICCVVLILTPFAHWALDVYDAYQRARVRQAKRRAEAAFRRAVEERRS